MWAHKLFVLACLVHTSLVRAQWVCTENSDCSDLEDSVCLNGACTCPTGKQIALAGSACVDLAPYHTSTCVEDHQCSRLFTMFECRKENETEIVGSCLCQPGFHYFLGRCWPTVDFGGQCSTDEQCIGTPRNPFGLQCRSGDDGGRCACADGYYERQRGECRQIGFAVGDGCVVDEDCQFTNGVCEINSRQCIDSTAPPATTSAVKATPVNVNVTVTAARSVRSHGVACSVSSPCPAPFECSNFGACICPVGYYLSDNGLLCNAELGSRSTPEQCVGLLAEVINGICTCPANFFFEENMRDCIKVTRQITDSCVTDANCHTFGAASVCGEPQELWGLRTCECDEERAVWDSARQMCRLFAGIGEYCEVDTDCLAGELEIQCVAGQCACPAGLTPVDGLCLTTGLGLNDTCQATIECTETANTVCAGGVCACDAGYQAIEDFCAPIIGGTCAYDDDCVIAETVCVNNTHTCQCRGGFVAHNDNCLNVSTGFLGECMESVQCTAVLGDNALCLEGECGCIEGTHHRDGSCWPQTHLFEPCSRTSQCYLTPLLSERTVCRNSICQCDFQYPYSELLQTCVSESSASSIFGSITVIVTALAYLILS